LGTVNGIATSVSAVGRAAGPTVGGLAFTWGVKRGYIITPFWVLACFGALNTIPVLWLVEGDGFGDDDEEDDDEEVAIAVEGEENYEGAFNDGRKDSAPEGIEGTERDDSVGPLLSRESTLARTISRQRQSHTNSVTSTVIDESEGDYAYDEEEDPWPPQWSEQPSTSATGQSSPLAGRPRAPRRRRSSIPIGGPGFRRMSSNLGQTRSGFGDGGGLGGG